MVSNFPNLMITINPRIQEFQQIQSPKNMTKTPSRHVIIKLFKTSNKEKILKVARKGGGEGAEVQTETTRTTNGGIFLIRDNANLKTVERHLWRLKEKKTVNFNSISGQSTFQKWKQNQGCFIQIKSKRMHHQQVSTTQNVKISTSEKGKWD